MTNPNSKNITQLLADENPVGLIFLKNDIFEYVNKSFVEIFNTSSAHLIGKSIFSLVHKNDHALLNKQIDLLKTKQLKKINHIHLRINTKIVCRALFFTIMNKKK